ncbi:MAG: rod shape-determining protein MreC [Candidatus Baumannia cicadellinicola]|nr:rod shape-determining protein MreC [Candidatus Baumannia cicadellinicola]
MKPIRGNSMSLRLYLAMIVAIILIIVDNRLDSFTTIRMYMDTVLSPIYLFTNSTVQKLDNLSTIFTTNAKLKQENRALRQELILQKSKQLLLMHYKQENTTLRKLLIAPLHHDEHTILTKVISLQIDPYINQIVIDKGWNNGIYIGQPVISDQGIVGQVIATSKYTSRILLICDTSHAIPIQVLRNNIRGILIGKGCNADLQIEYLPQDLEKIDIHVGDLLVTSGLGGRFPEGYPVAVVSSVKLDLPRTHMLIKAKPIATLQHLHYLLLLWKNK